MNTQLSSKMASWRRLGAAVGCLLLLAGNAWGQWGWTNAAGQKEFSDLRPPPEVPDNKIFLRPSGAVRVTQPAKPAEPSAKSEGQKGELQQKVDAEKKKADAEAEAKRQEMLAKRKEQRADNCSRAKGRKAAIDSGRRMSKTLENGERVFLDEAGRDAELQRANKLIESECGPDPMASEAAGQ